MLFVLLGFYICSPFLGRVSYKGVVYIRLSKCNLRGCSVYFSNVNYTHITSVSIVPNPTELYGDWKEHDKTIYSDLQNYNFSSSNEYQLDSALILII